MNMRTIFLALFAILLLLVIVNGYHLHFLHLYRYFSPIRSNLEISRNKTKLAAEFRILIQGTKNAYTTVRTGDILSYRLNESVDEKNVRLGVCASDGKLYPLCNRVEYGSEFYVDPLTPPLSIENLRKEGRLLRVISSDRRGETYTIEEYLDESIFIPVVTGKPEVTPEPAKLTVTSTGNDEKEIQDTLNQISSLNQKLVQLIVSQRGGSSSNSSKVVVESLHAPKPVGPYSQAVKSNGILYISGCIGLDSTSGKLISDDLKEQTIQALKNLHAVLREAKSDWNFINKVTIFTTDIKQFSVINSIYSAFLKENNVTDYPARSTVEVSALPLGAKFEIEAIAGYVE